MALIAFECSRCFLLVLLVFNLVSPCENQSRGRRWVPRSKLTPSVVMSVVAQPPQRCSCRRTPLGNIIPSKGLSQFSVTFFWRSRRSFAFLVFQRSVQLIVRRVKELTATAISFQFNTNKEKHRQRCRMANKWGTIGCSGSSPIFTGAPNEV